MNNHSCRIAVAQCALTRPKSVEDYYHQLDNLMMKLHNTQAEVALLPEYISLPLQAVSEAGYSLLTQWQAMQDQLPQYQKYFAEYARKWSMLIVAGTFPVRTEQQHYTNRCLIFLPNGEIISQDKIVLVPEERNYGILYPGDRLWVLETAKARIAVNVCYDCEFPTLAASLAQAQVQIILIPSCTTSYAGYHRVNIAARARALENQCYTVVSPLIYADTEHDVIGGALGRAGIFCCPDESWQSDGILQRGEWHKNEWIIRDVDLNMLKHQRQVGEVTTFTDNQVLKTLHTTLVSRNC